MRLFGLAATRCESAVRRYARDDARRERVGGFALAFSIVGGTFVAAACALAFARARSGALGDALESALGWTTIAARDLLVESGAVRDALEAGDLDRARVRVARIVGRETHDLSERDVARAAIETLAESLCDGIVAPLALFAIFGAPAALAFKAASTLDSMLGHIEPPYTHLGYASAKLDDALCWIPARIAAIAIAVVAPLAGGRIDVALRTLREDGARHASPNAGRPEAAMAGALGVRLGGRNCYDGTIVDAPYLGRTFAPPQIVDVRRAERLTLAATLLCACVALGTRAVLDAR